LKLIAVSVSAAVHTSLLTGLLLQRPPLSGSPTAATGTLPIVSVSLVRADTLNAAESQSISPAGSGRESDSTNTVKAPTSPASPAAPAVSPGAGSAAHQPSTATTVAAAPPDLGVGSGAARSAYQDLLFAHVRRFRLYPEDARRHGLEGVVQVHFALDRSGDVLAAWVETSSGFQALDAAALETVRRAQPLPAIPAELPDQMDVLLPVVFSLPKSAQSTRRDLLASTTADFLNR
jgi:protein TonB